jgi:MYXO-CTERM domain-containing protein
LAGYPSNAAVSLNHDNQYVSTSLSGGFNGAGTIMAWINPAVMPSSVGMMYIAGESAGNNDFDLQFSGNTLAFYTTGGGAAVGYNPDTSTLVGQWHLIFATYDSNAVSLYWDGTLANSTSGNSTTKTQPFTFGYSPVWGRPFDGMMDEVAVWNSALTASQVSSIYASASQDETTPEPASGLLACGAFAAIWLLRRRLKHGQRTTN